MRPGLRLLRGPATGVRDVYFLLRPPHNVLAASRKNRKTKKLKKSKNAAAGRLIGHGRLVGRATRAGKVRRGLLRFPLGLPDSMRSARKVLFFVYGSSALRVVKFSALMRPENFAEAAVKGAELALGSSGLVQMQKGAEQKGPHPYLPHMKRLGNWLPICRQ